MKVQNTIIEIMDFGVEELDVYARYSEIALYRMNEPKPGMFIAESPKVIERALMAGYEPVSFLMEKKDIEGEARKILSKYPKIAVYAADPQILTRLTGFQLTRGMLCAMKRRELPSLEEIIGNARRIAILENIVNPTNVGAIFRSAAALKMDAVILTRGCSNPLYRRASRVSMGTVFQVPWTILEEHITWPGRGMEILKQYGFKTAAMALSDQSVSIADEALSKEDKLAIILGTEGEGLQEETIRLSDYTVKIPMANGVDSLNVAAASAVAFWELGKA